MRTWQWALIAAAGVALLWAVVAFNRLVRFRNRVREAWSGIDVQLRRRHDLVPALVETVKGYARHEESVLTDVATARAPLLARPAEQEAVERELTDRIVRLFALVEAYPELRADQNFRRLHHDLVEIEDALQYARRYYNGAVRDLNNAVESFPSSLVARAGGFETQPFFEVDSAAERLAVRVDLTS